MVKAAEIQKKLMNFVRGSYDVVLPNFYYGYHECDLFRITGADLVVEYEIKVSRSDFFTDFKKGRLTGGEKHTNLQSGGENVPNRFLFVVPDRLVTVEEVPPYAGLIYYRDGGLIHIKSGKLLHRRKFTNWRDICHTLAYRDEIQRTKISWLRNTDLGKEMAAMKRELAAMKEQNRELRRELNTNRILSQKK
jgi:hypothetical protein